jgi:hypothetical protein
MVRELGHLTWLGVAPSHMLTGVQTPTDPCRLFFIDNWVRGRGILQKNLLVAN